jgi:hypothetical protein
MSELEPSLLNDQQLLTNFAEKEIIDRASVLACECPRYLVDILIKVRDFQQYELKCQSGSEKDRDTHEWLFQAAINIDQMLSATIIQLARLEGMIDEQNRIINHPNAKA